MRSLTPVDSADIAVVIQGPLARNLGPERGIFTCIASIRRHLPRAEIIVSTWCHEDVSGLDVEQILVLEDPGCFLDDSDNQINTNRMLRSTLPGIEAATRPYVMKLRADHHLTSAALAVIGEPEPAGTARTKLFATPITLTTLYIRNPERVPMLFHISDLVQFGTRDAMLALWSQPLLERTELFNDRPSRNPFGNFSGFSSVRMVAEQSLMLGCMRTAGIDVRLDHPCQVRSTTLMLWDSVLSHNFRVLDFKHAGVEFPERLVTAALPWRTLYTAAQIEQLRSLDKAGYRSRILRIWVNQYLLSFLRPGWWISLAAIVLFSISPTVAKSVRTRWRKQRKLTHADSNRI